jgi:glutathionylspermidine synthase
MCAGCQEVVEIVTWLPVCAECKDLPKDLCDEEEAFNAYRKATDEDFKMLREQMSRAAELLESARATSDQRAVEVQALKACLRNARECVEDCCKRYGDNENWTEDNVLLRKIDEVLK